jgi:hypothetical protein
MNFKIRLLRRLLLAHLDEEGIQTKARPNTRSEQVPFISQYQSLFPLKP